MGTAVSVWRERGAVSTVRYLRLVGLIDLLGAVWVSFGNDIRRHDVDEYLTPYLLTAGYTPAFLALFLAVTMRRRKRAAWLLNLVLAGLYLLFLAAATAVPAFRGHPQNWVSLGITAAFCAALLAGRRAFRAKGDRSNPGWPRRSPSAASRPADSSPRGWSPSPTPGTARPSAGGTRTPCSAWSRWRTPRSPSRGSRPRAGSTSSSTP